MFAGFCGRFLLILSAPSQAPKLEAALASPAPAAGNQTVGTVEQAVKTPWKTPAPVFPQANASPATCSATRGASGWQATYADAGASPATAGAPEIPAGQSGKRVVT